MITPERLARMREWAGPIGIVGHGPSDAEILELVTAYVAAREWATQNHLAYRGQTSLRDLMRVSEELLYLFPEPTKAQPPVLHDPNNDFCPCFGCNGMRMCTD